MARFAKTGQKMRWAHRPETRRRGGWRSWLACLPLVGLAVVFFLAVWAETFCEAAIDKLLAWVDRG